MATTASPFRLEDFIRPHLLSLRAYTPGEQPQGGKFIKLNTNENPYPPSPTALAAMSDFAERLRKYPDPSATAFRRLAAQKWRVTPEQIVCGNGSDELLALIIRLFLGPEDLAVWAQPTYLLYQTLVQIQGARYQSFDYAQDWSLPEAMLDSSAKLALIANPNSPSGTCLSIEQLRQVLSRLRCPVVVDEAYADFSGQTAVGLVDEFPHLIVTRTLSKSYAMAGLRFGYLVASREMADYLHRIRDSYNCDAVATAVATAALSDQAWLEDNVQRVVEQRGVLEQALAQLGFQVQPSQANFVWCHHPRLEAKAIYEQLKARQILVRYMDYGPSRVGLRITVGTPGQNHVLIQQLQELVTTLGQD